MTANAATVSMTSPDPNQDFDQLVGLIYEAAVQPSAWQDVALALSEALGGHSVTVWLRLPSASDATQLEGYRSHDLPIPESVFAEHWQRGLPWGSTIADGPTSETRDRFVDFSALFPNERLAETDYYKEWLEPRGLAPMSPICHVFAADGDAPTGAVTIQIRAGLPLLDEDQFAFADRLAPHLARAHRILDSHRSLQREQDVFREVLDRIPTGIVLVDEDGRVVIMNESARIAMSSGNSLRISDGRPVVDDPEENRWLQGAIDRARDPQTRAEFDRNIPPAARRQKGDDHSPMFVTPLAAAASESSLPDTAAMILLGNPRLAHVTAISLLRSLYSLTRAEAELTWLLAEGHSLEEAASERSVTLNTARSQLKRVFAKTGAKRQADLVRIVLGGAGAVRDLP